MYYTKQETFGYNINESEMDFYGRSGKMIDAIFNRRSIRKYTDEKIPYEKVEDILKAGMAAPSAGNEQPWHFVVIDDKDTMMAITKFHPYSSMLKSAKYAIVVCGDLNLQRFEGYWVQDCSAAAENMLLAANDAGLGSVWLGVYPMEDRINGLKELLNLPESVIPLCILPLGYPAENRPAEDRYKKERVHKNAW